MASIKSSGDTTLATINYKVTSSDLSFDNSYYFASSNTSSNFNVYYWTGSAWSSKYTQTKSGNFGHQIACTWDGDRFVVGSPHENKVYVYHSPGGTGSQKWTHNASGQETSPTVHTISCPDSSTTGRRFGWSVAIAKDLGNHIIIGAPGDFTQSDSDGQKRGKVYVYEFNGSTWSKTFDKTDSGAHTDVSNAGSSVSISEPEIQLKESSATSGQAFYQVNNASPQFGFYVDISGYAEYIAIGVPGTPIGLLNSTNLDGYSGSDSIDRTGGNSDYFENTAQLGCVACYKTSNTNKSWASNTSLHGKPVRGQTEMSWTSGLIGDNSSNTVIWDFTALGTTCKISLDGNRLIGGSPRYSYPGKQQSPNFGRLDAWNYSTTDSDWVLGKGRVVGNRPGNRLGMNIAVDYTGQRVAALYMKEPTEYATNTSNYDGQSGIMIFDWNGNGFYEVVPEVQTNLGSNGDHTYGSVAISKGDTVAATAYNLTTNGTATFYFYKLTGGYDGNSLVGGYCAADAFLVGPNDGSTENTFKKQIKFGGTFFDNDYENTTIENRIYHFDPNNTDGNQQGFSELLVSKKTGADAPDMIRFKSNEFRIDTYINQTSTNTNQFYTSADGEYDHHPALTMNIAGNFKLNPEFLLKDTSLTSGNATQKLQSGIENTQCETKALLDVEGDIFGRRRINAGYKFGQEILGRKWPWQILYDTRSAHTKRDNNLYSNTFNEFNSSASYKHGRVYSKGVGSGTGNITHYESEGAITLPNTDFRILNNDWTVAKSIGGNGISGSFWFKLKNEHSTYSSDATVISYGDPHATNHNGFRFQVTSTTIQFNFGNGIIKPSSNYSLTQHKWYHIYYAFKPNSITSWASSSSSTRFYLWINGIEYSGSLLLTGSNLSNASGYSGKHYIGSPLNDSATNIYIGMVAHYNSHIYQQFHGTADNYIGQFANVSEMYNWGSPGQKLAVGGDAYIQNRLSINHGHSPKAALDVVGDVEIIGDINFTGDLKHNGDQNLDLEPVYINKTQSSNNPPLKVSASTTHDTTTSNGILLKGNTPDKPAIIAIEVDNALAGNALVSWNTNQAGGGWCMGADNNAGDKLKIANSASALQSDTHMEFSSSGTDFKKAILANGSVGTNGQVLTSSGGGTVSWADSGGGGSSLWTELSDGGTSHPTSGMTSSTSGNPQYQASASTYLGGLGGSGLGDAWRAFNGSIGDEGWHAASSRYSTTTGNYTGSDSTTYNGSSSVSGDWIELTTPTQTPPATGISMNEVQIAPRTGYLNRCAGDGMILGRYNGSSTYDLIHSFTNKTYTNGNYTSITFPSSNAYRYFRIVITKLSGSVGESVLNISEIKFITSNSINRPGANVGIGIPSPSYKLEVAGDINITGSDSFLRKNGNKIPEWTQTPSSTTDVYRLGKVGIGTSSPGSTLDVDGDINISTGSSFKINGVAQNFNTGSSLSGTDTFEWGAGVSGKHTNAGKIGYSFNRSGAGANDELDIIGAGTTTYGRYIRLYDKIGVGDNSASNTVPRTACINVRPYGHSNPDYNGLYIYTPTDTGAQDAIVACRTGGSGGGDPYISFDVKDQNGWCWGIDNSDDDKMKLGANWDSLANDTKMTIDRSGNVGIGTSSPNSPLHIYEETGSSRSSTSGTLVLEHNDSGGSSCIVFPSKRNYNSDYGYIQFEDSTSSGDEKSRLIIGTENDGPGSNEDNVILSPTGKVGIKTNTPQRTLDVDGDSRFDAGVHLNWSSPTLYLQDTDSRSSMIHCNSSYFYILRGSGNNSTSWSAYNSRWPLQINLGNNDFSIGGGCYSVSYHTHSDARIKKDIVDIDDTSALEKLRLLQPKTYKYRNEDNGTDTVYGFIAQDVSNVLPYAVSIKADPVPTILSSSNVTALTDTSVQLTLDKTIPDDINLTNTSNISITVDGIGNYICPVISTTGNNIITIEKTSELSNITSTSTAYIFGEHVQDFHNLKKDAIFTVATAALQEVDRQLQAEKTKVATLETQVANLLARVTALENA